MGLTGGPPATAGLVDDPDGSGPPDGERGFLSDVAVNGVLALDDPVPRSVLDGRRRPTRPA